VAGLLTRLEKQKILAGIDLGRFDPGQKNRLLVCVTEQNSREQIDALVEGLQGGAA